MKNPITQLVIVFFFVFLFPLEVHADIGPKPSTRIDFIGSQGETYYATLLTENTSSAAYEVYSGNLEADEYARQDVIWKKFVEYKDEDGFHFLQNWRDCSETNKFVWDYDPPSPFKVLVYFPKTDTFYVSGIYETYALHSIYTVDLSQCLQNDKSEPEELLVRMKDDSFIGDIFFFIIRIGLTILVEIILALAFGYKERKVMDFIAKMNIGTQIFLNIALHITHCNVGSLKFFIFYFLFEGIVFVIEAVAYARTLPKLSEKQHHLIKTILYAFAANVMSFVIGVFIAFCMS